MGSEEWLLWRVVDREMGLLFLVWHVYGARAVKCAME